jgi:hypothetical protein
MPPLVKRFVTIVPNGVDQETEPTLLAPGKLVEALDVHQPTPGLLEKRNGVTAMSRAEAPPLDELEIQEGKRVASTGDALMVVGRPTMASTDAIVPHGLFARSEVLGGWLYKGPTPDVKSVPPPFAQAAGYRPSMVETEDGLRYYFAGDTGNDAVAPITEPLVGNGNTAQVGAAASWWRYRIVDSDGVEVVASTRITDAIGWMAKPVVAGGFVWLFVGAYGTPRRYIDVFRFNPVDPAAGYVRTIYYDGGLDGSMAVHGFDVRLVNGAATVVVVGTALAQQGGGTASAVCSRLDVATGQPAVAFGSVGLTHASAVASQACVTWMQAEGEAASPTSIYVVVTVLGNPRVITITAATLASSAGVDLGTYEATATLVAGYVQATTGHFVTFCSGPSTSPEEDRIQRFAHEVSGTFYSSLAIAYGVTLSSFPFRRALAEQPTTGGWFVYANQDDNHDLVDPAAEALLHAQAAYLLIDEDGTIMARTLSGRGGDVGQRAAWRVGAANMGWLAPVVVGEDSVSCCLNSWSGSGFVSRAVQFDFDAVDGPMSAAARGQEITIPGGWPHRISAGQLSEHVPQYPRLAPTLGTTASGGAGLATGWYAVCYTYIHRDAAGNVLESRASPLAAVEITAANECIEMTLQRLHVTNMPSGWFDVAVYVTERQSTEADALAKTPYLQATVPNDPYSLAVFLFVLDQTAIATDETLYTHAGAELENDPPPPFTWAAPWGDRNILGGTDQEGVLWISKKKQDGRGYAYSVTLALLSEEGSGDFRAGAAIDEQFFAAFKEDGIWILSGPGPDSAGGRDQYQPQRLPGTVGCSNPRAVCTTPIGVFFQAHHDLGMYLLTREMRVIYMGKGIDRQRGRTVTAIVYDPQDDQVRVFLEAA